VATWTYRVAHKAGRYGVHRVYASEAGEIWTCTEDPVRPEGETLDELREALKWHQRALEQPALEYTDLAPDYDPDSLDIEESF
jgi:hypothetical protein